MPRPSRILLIAVSILTASIAIAAEPDSTPTVAPVTAPAPINDPRSSTVPLLQGLSSLAKGDLNEADRWFEVTSNDFPERLDGLRALTLQILHRVAEELSDVRMATHLSEGVKMELKEKRRWNDLVNDYEKQALHWGDQLYNKAVLFYARDAKLTQQGTQTPLQLDIALDRQEHAAVSKGRSKMNKEDLLGSAARLRSRLTKGELLDDTEMRQLERAEWLSNYIGFIGDVMQLSDEQLLAGVYSGSVSRAAFYRGVGARLFILWGRNKDERYRDLAARYFDKVLALTEAEPYQADRQKAKDFLAQIELSKETKSTGKAGKSNVKNKNAAPRL